MKLSKILILILSLCAILYVSASFANADDKTKDNTSKPVEIAFPLPWRDQRLIADAMNQQTSLSDIRAMLKGKDSSVRLEAVRALGERSSQNYLYELDKLASGNDAIAAAAKVASEWITARIYAGENAEEKLIAFLKSDSLYEQQEAAYALIKINSPKSTSALLEYAQSHNTPTRFQAVLLQELAKRRVKETVPLLAKFGGVNPNEIVGGTGSGKITNQDFDQLIVWYWKLQLQGKSPAEQANFFKMTLDAGHVFGGIKFRDAAQDIGTSLLPYLRKFAADKDASLTVRWWSTELLGYLHDKESIQLLQRIYENENLNKQVREAAFTSWILTGDPKAIAKLQQNLAYSLNKEKIDAYVLVCQLWDVQYMAQMTGADSLAEDMILPFLQSAEWAKGANVAVMIARSIGSVKSIEPLINVVNNGIVEEGTGYSQMQKRMLHSSAVTTLGFVGARVTDSKAQQKVLFFLIDQCYDNDPITHIVAVQALARMAGAEGIPVILDMVKKEKDGAAMRFEISGIYKAGGPDAVTALNALQKFAVDNKNDQMQELCEEGLLRLKREGRDKEVKPVTYPGDSGGLFN